MFNMFFLQTTGAFVIQELSRICFGLLNNHRPSFELQAEPAAEPWWLQPSTCANVVQLHEFSDEQSEAMEGKLRKLGGKLKLGADMHRSQVSQAK